MSEINIVTRGEPTAPVYVVCEPPNGDRYNPVNPTNASSVRLFLDEAKKAGFTESDFYFIGPCPPIPVEFKKSKSKTWNFVSPYADKVKEILNANQNKVTVSLGDIATRIASGRAMAITKVRGTMQDGKLYPMFSPSMCRAYLENMPIFVSDMGTLGRLKKADYDTNVLSADNLNKYWCTDIEALEAILPSVIAVDTETTGLRGTELGFDVLSVQIGYSPTDCAVIPLCPEYWPESEGEFTLAKRMNLIAGVKRICENQRIRKVGHNINYERMALETIGIMLRGVAADTMLMTWHVDENMRSKTLDDVVRRFVPELAGLNDKYNNTLDKTDMRNQKPEDVLQYAGNDGIMTYRAFYSLWPKIRDDKQQLNLFKNIKMPGLYACYIMEKYGVRVDTDYLLSIRDELADDVENLKAKLISLVPRDVVRKHLDEKKKLEFTRDAFVRDILFTPLGFNLTPVVFTDSTKDSANLAERVPSASSKQHLPYFKDLEGDAGEFVRELIEFKKLQKLLTTYVDGFADQYVHSDGAIHSRFNLHITTTGRSSSSGPNCFPGQVEILTKNGWTRFDELEEGVEVAQYDVDTKDITFATPNQYHAYDYKGELTHLKSDIFIDILCTPNHRFFTDNRKKPGDIKWCEASNYPSDRRQYVAGNYVGGTKSYTEAEVILICALQADAYMKGTYADWQFSKDRKTNRLCSALDSLGITYRKTYSEKKQTHRIACHIPKEYSSKKFLGSWLLELDRETLDFFKDELWQWDGCYTRQNMYASVTKSDCDWAQIVQILSDRRTNLSSFVNNVGSHYHVLNTSRRDYSLSTNVRKNSVDHDGQVYCVTMPKGTIIVRHNDKPIIVGNCQNFPARGKWSSKYKKAFKARPGYKFVSADLSQIELRLIAWESQDPVMMDAYINGKDIHTITAMAVLGYNQAQWDTFSKAEKKLARFKAKAVNFGFCYGMRAKKFRAYAKTDYDLILSEREAQVYYDTYHRLYRNIGHWHNRRTNEVKKNGEVRALHGAVRRLPSVFSEDAWIKSSAERQAINSPIQAFGSDLGLLAIARLCRQVDMEIIRPVMFIHDDVILEVKDGYEQEAIQTLLWVMNDPPLGRIIGRTAPLPILAEPDIGLNLGEMYEIGSPPEGEDRPDWYPEDNYDITPKKPDFWRDDLDICPT